jgi:integrase
MRPPRRAQGRYASLSGLRVVRYPGNAHWPRIVVDRTGLPVAHLTEYYRVRIREPGPRTTTETYFGYLLPVTAYVLERGWNWCAPPEEVREHLLAFFFERLHCQMRPDADLEGYRLTRTQQTPLSESALRGVWSALRDFYRIMQELRYYPYDQNPLVSRLLTQLRQQRAQAIHNRGAPDHAGIRSEPLAASGRRPNAFFRSGRSGRWEPDERLSLPQVMSGLGAAVEHMLHDPQLRLRDRAVIGLLRNTRARASEITDMTVGGYRAFTRDGILGEALVVNKGSGGIAEKRLYFHEAVRLQRTLLRYLREERPRWDPKGCKRLADLPDEAPFFLTARGTPYTYETFKWQWRKVYPAARRHCPIDFSPHDLRHLLVTELLVRARAQCDPHSPEYADIKRGLVDLFAWTDPATIEVYDHSVNRVEALGLLGAWQRAIATRSARTVREGSASPVPPGQVPHETSIQGADRLALPVAAAEAAPSLADMQGERATEGEDDTGGGAQQGEGGAAVSAPGASTPHAPAAVEGVDDIAWFRRRGQRT